MTINIVILGEKATAEGPFPLPFIRLIAALSGRKQWSGNKQVAFEASPSNIMRIRDAGFDVYWDDQTATLEAMRQMETMPTQHQHIALPAIDYKPRMPWFKHQENVIALSWDRLFYALLLEMGLGKTAILIACAALLFITGRITGLLVLSPRGVHRQWIYDQFPVHIDPRIEYSANVWNSGMRAPTLRMLNRKCLNVLSANIDSIRTDVGFNLANEFLQLHAGKCMMIIDESHLVKTYSAARTKAALELGLQATYRRISTGTPISHSILDAFSQFMFLDQQILGHRYLTSFRSRFCIMGGWENRQVIGQKNVEEFYTMIAPHSYRLTKEEALDLPPKMYVQREYEMSTTTRKLYDEIRKTFMAELGDGRIMDVKTGAEALLRLQQILGGYVVIDGNLEATGGTERLEECIEIIEQSNGPIVIWARFINDIKQLEKHINERPELGGAVTYYGETNNKDREANKLAWLAGHKRIFISNPAAGGTGLNLQGTCQTVIYYSNSFDALHRWQSEDRTHRIGMGGTITYYDLVAYRSIDKFILANLQRKKSISDLTFDDIRKAIIVEGT